MIACCWKPPPGIPILIERRLASASNASDGSAGGGASGREVTLADRGTSAGARRSAGRDCSRTFRCSRCSSRSCSRSCGISKPAAPCRIGSPPAVRWALPANVQVTDAAGDKLLGLAQSGREQSLVLDEPGLYSIISQQGTHRLEVVRRRQQSRTSAVMPASELQAWEQRHAKQSQASGERYGRARGTVRGVDQRIDRIVRRSCWPLRIASLRRHGPGRPSRARQGWPCGTGCCHSRSRCWSVNRCWPIVDWTSGGMADEPDNG